jgi:hypothetical protein
MVLTYFWKMKAPFIIAWNNIFGNLKPENNRIGHGSDS